MKPRFLAASTLLVTMTCAPLAFSQTSMPPVSPTELEALYTGAIESRTTDIVKALNLSDDGVSNSVHDLIIAQYRVMRARDALMDAQLKAMGKEINYQNRASQLQAESKPLHDYFFARLSEKLTPAQVDQIKDKMTYNKAKVTYDAYVAIVPGLTDAEKTKILELLKAAREEAVDGGSAPEKSAIFQKYKNQINDYLNTSGHDVAQAYKDWEAKQPVAAAGSENSTANANPMQK